MASSAERTTKAIPPMVLTRSMNMSCSLLAFPVAVFTSKAKKRPDGRRMPMRSEEPTQSPYLTRLPVWSGRDPVLLRRLNLGFSFHVSPSSS